VRVEEDFGGVEDVADSSRHGERIPQWRRTEP
jgi:hypothetical protein